VSGSPQRSPELSVVVTSLMRGVVYRDAQESLWRDLLATQAQARDAVGLLGLQVVIDDAEGYAYLRQVPDDERDERVPRLVPRRELPFDVSLLLALLRKRLAQADAEGGEPRVVVTRAEVVDMLRVFLEGSGEESRLVERSDALMRRVVDLGFLRPARPVAAGGDLDSEAGRDSAPQADSFEIRRILKAFVDAQWLADFDARLGAYLAHAGGES
jgi:hypothetical protein